MNTLQMEDRVPPQLVTELESRGHDVTVGTGIFGSGGMIRFSDDRASAEIGVDQRFSTSYGVVLE
jgi:gamma-glutamyltranspeptidase/glutathione hydrolase